MPLIDEYANTASGGGGDTSTLANKSDISEIQLTGTTNTSGSTITNGTYFYLNGSLVRAKADIASGATFTENTNYESVSVGEALVELNSKITPSGYPSIVDWSHLDVDGVNYNPYIAWRNGDGSGQGTLPPTSSKVGFLINQPIYANGINNGIILQLFYDYSGTSNIRWQRYYSNSSWTSWY